MTRVRSLDGLRGVCALVVVLFHWWLVMPSAWALVSGSSADTAMALWTRTPLSLLIAGPAAVSIFFAISGFALTVSFIQVDRGDYGQFVVKRACRIYLPYAAAILLSAAAFHLVRPTAVPEASGWFNGYSWSHWPSRKEMLSYALLLNKDISLDPAIWSLGPELRIALVFPFLLILLRRWTAPTLAVSAAAGLGAQLAVTIYPLHWPATEVLVVVKNAYLFAFGALLALRREGPGPRTAGRASAGALWLAATAMLLVANAVDLMNIRTAAAVLTGLAAILITYGATRERSIASSLLSGRGPVWLGKISFSLYLLHIPVMLLVCHGLPAGLGLLPRFLLAMPLTFALAWLSSVTVEKGSQRLGRELARVLARLAGAQAASEAVRPYPDGATAALGVWRKPAETGGN